MGACQLEAKNWESPAHAAGTDDEFFRLQPKPALRLDGMRVHEARLTRLLVDRHSERIDLLAQGRMRAYIGDDLTRARKQPSIIQHRLGHGDAVFTQLTRFPKQPGSMSQDTHRNRAVVIRHTAELAAGYQRSASPELSGTDGGDHTRRSGADDNDI
jgi:hypothetical protein